MRKLTVLASLALASLALAGCLGGDSDETDTGNDDEPMQDSGFTWDPSMLPESVTGMEYVTNANTDGAAGIWLHDDKAYLSGGAGLRIFDITEPAVPVLLSTEIEDTSSRDVDILEHPNGRLYAVLSAGGVALVDVTDPASAHVVSEASVSSHNMAVVPNTTLVYNSRSISGHIPGPGETGQVDIIDFADPENPTVTVFPFPAVIMDPNGVPRTVQSSTCHDITFNAELARAYCAGVTDTTIWDISDPAAPVIIQVIDWPGTNIHHGVWDARGGDLLILGDEFAGVAAPSPPCSETFRDPTSALWFYDISDLGTPTPIGYFQIEWEQLTADDESSPVPRYCSTHFGTTIEDRDLLVMGWYSAGTVLVDFSDPANAQQVAHHHAAGTNTWESRYYKGHVYTGDTGLGMDVLRLI